MVVAWRRETNSNLPYSLVQSKPKACVLVLNTRGPTLLTTVEQTERKHVHRSFLKEPINKSDVIVLENKVYTLQNVAAHFDFFSFVIR